MSYATIAVAARIVRAAAVAAAAKERISVVTQFIVWILFGHYREQLLVIFLLSTTPTEIVS
jgi:hypothetical protein